MARKPRATKANGETKAAKAEAAPAAGHNLSPEQRQALFFTHLGPIRRKKEQIASLTGELRALYKAAKTHDFAKRQFDFALAVEKDEGDALIQVRREQDEIALWMGHPVGHQPDLPFDSVDRRPADERAYDDGKRAGMEGESMKPPEHWPTGGGLHQAWCRGWHDGQEAIFAISELKDGPSLIKGNAEVAG